MSETIVAIATPVAPAGLGVIRLSGSDAVLIADRVFRPLKAGETLAGLGGYTARYGHVFDSSGDLDDAVALVFTAPHSYTGENVVELTCHGGVYLLQRVVRACVAAGARPAGPGEFTKRAFLNGKMDLTGADAVMQIIAADGALSLKTAEAAREGNVYRTLASVKNALSGVQAQFMAYIDYPDDDIPDLPIPQMRADLSAAADTLRRLVDTFDAGKVVREGVDTAIVGCPNVGKSTLMNRLTGEDSSIVTAVAGTTRDIVEQTVRVGDITLRLADTAGQHAGGDEVETIGIARAKERMRRAALVLAVFDASKPLSADDRDLLRSLKDLPVIGVLNKAELPRKIDPAPVEAVCRYTVSLSAATGEGVNDLIGAVATLTGVAGLREDEPLLATERQYAAARVALAAVTDAVAALDAGLPPDAAGMNVDAAITAIGELTGERASQTVVDEIFARFCVGK